MIYKYEHCNPRKQDVLSVHCVKRRLETEPGLFFCIRNVAIWVLAARLVDSSRPYLVGELNSLGYSTASGGANQCC